MVEARAPGDDDWQNLSLSERLSAPILRDEIQEAFESLFSTEGDRPSPGRSAPRAPAPRTPAAPMTSSLLVEEVVGEGVAAGQAGESRPNIFFLKYIYSDRTGTERIFRELIFLHVCMFVS